MGFFSNQVCVQPIGFFLSVLYSLVSDFSFTLYHLENKGTGKRADVRILWSAVVYLCMYVCVLVYSLDTIFGSKYMSIESQ
jgi:drug/metabolite transporter (DMT)-like permease